MSEVPFRQDGLNQAEKSLWPVAAIILALVFAPAAITWVVGLIR